MYFVEVEAVAADTEKACVPLLLLEVVINAVIALVNALMVVKAGAVGFELESMNPAARLWSEPSFVPMVPDNATLSRPVCARASIFPDNAMYE